MSEPRERTTFPEMQRPIFLSGKVMLEDGSAPAVYTVKAGKAARTALKLGYVDGQWVEVREGLREGDPVVVAGKASLREGSAVQVIGATAAPATTQAPTQ